MGLLSFFAKRRLARNIAQTASQVAERSVAPVLDRVRRRATTMRVAEARGYVRSRALDIVHRELATLCGGRIPFDPPAQASIIGQATDAVVLRVMAELRSVPPAAKPARRKAA
jgi:hypothetical protein